MARATKKKRLVLLDSHAIIHRAYHALPDFMSSGGEPTGALYGLTTMLLKIATDLSPDYIVACFDLPQKTFRHEAYEAYKGTRQKADDALVSQIIRSREIFKAFSIPVYDMPGFEADDVLGTIVEQVKKDKDYEIIIASGDMDTLQLVEGTHVKVFTLKKGITDTVVYDETAVVARYGFAPKLLPDYKGLRGDPSDNIVGIKGIGEKTATTLITTFGTIEKIYSALKKDDHRFEEIGITPRVKKLLLEGHDEALFSKTLATIRKDAPIVFSIPEKTFKEALDNEALRALCTNLEFRSLIPRIALLTSTQSSVEPQVRENISNEELLPVAVKTWLLNSDLTNPSLDDILRFSKRKTFNEAKESIDTMLENDKDLFSVWKEIEEPIIPLVTAMEQKGVCIDTALFSTLAKEYKEKLSMLTKEIYSYAGGEFNINSPKQLSEILFGKLGLVPKGKRGETGSFSTKVEVLEELYDTHPIIGVIMRYRELQKLVSTYIEVIPTLLDVNGRLHAQFLQHGTTTGRFASQNPNLQNIPIRTELGRAIRKGFVAPQGRVLVAFDYGQMELRIMAMLSRDEKLLHIFKEGKDIHSGVAAYIFNVPEDRVDAEMRRKAKVVNFGILYGMGVLALKKNLETTKEEAQRYYTAYFEEFKGVREYIESIKEYARVHGCTATLFGRKRSFESIRSKIPHLRALAERMAMNAPIQGTEADMIKLAIRFAKEDLEKIGLASRVDLIMQIHDELVYEIDNECADEAIVCITKAMEEVLSRSYIHYQSPIPFVVNAKKGASWDEAK
jgi:DNA polymerase-1